MMTLQSGINQESRAPICICNVVVMTCNDMEQHHLPKTAHNEGTTFMFFTEAQFESNGKAL